MKKILFVSPGQPSKTPRLVRNASALGRAGHEIHIAYPIVDPTTFDLDLDLAASLNWHIHPVHIFDANRLRSEIRFRRKFNFSLARFAPVARFGSRALVYGEKELRDISRAIDADFVFAQQQASIPLASGLAKDNDVNFGCDIEDILSESSSEPRRLIRAIEKKYLGAAAVVTTMSDVAAKHIQARYVLKAPCLVLHNCHARSESLDSANLSAAKGERSIYWFGQTLGSHSLALELIRANAALGNPFRIFLRGRLSGDYSKALADCIQDCGAGKAVSILDVVAPNAMVKEASDYAILFGSQPTKELFHQLAIGNKVFTGLAAGCRLLLSDTVAHRDFVQRFKVKAIFFDHSVEGSIEAGLMDLLNTDEASPPSNGQNMHHAALKVLDWDVESHLLTEAVSRHL